MFACYLKNLNETAQLTELTELLINLTFESSFTKLASPKKEYISTLKKNELVRCFMRNIENVCIFWIKIDNR